MALAALFASVPLSGASAAAAETKLYRYVIPTGTTPSTYVQPLSGTKAVGPYYRVTRDAKGLITSVETLRDGEVLSKASYVYAAGARHPDKTIRYVDGEESGYSLLTYYPNGREKRAERYTAEGKLTSSEDCDPVAQETVHCREYSAEGKLLRELEDTYGASGSRTKRKSWNEGDVYYTLYTIDPANGLELENRVVYFADGRVNNIAKSTYDSNGDRIRIDASRSDGSPLGSIEFSDGLSTKKTVNSNDGTIFVAVHHYDSKRQWDRSDVVVNGKAAFSLIYVRRSDGTTVKTQALGTDGQLWAEYPGVAIDQVTRDGQVPGNPTLALVYHKDPWW